MAHKRMFSKDITTSDAFREMPASAQSLYFHLGMEADDDGFLDNYRGLMRAINASEDDFKILVGKRFLILFPSKIIVIKHWLINNTVRNDRYKETKHLDEKKALIVKENGSYTEKDKSGIPNGNQVATQYRIGEDRIEEKRDASQNKNFAPRSLSKKEKQETPMVLNQFVEWCKKSTQRHIQIIGEWAETVKPDLQNRGQWESYIKRHLRAARLLVPFSQEQLERGYEKMMKEKNWLNRYTLETLLKFIC